MIVYYLYHTRDGKNQLMAENLNACLILGDYPLFDTAEACIDYWKKQGVEVDIYD
jgi:hypothetical protein